MVFNNKILIPLAFLALTAFVTEPAITGVRTYTSSQSSLSAITSAAAASDDIILASFAARGGGRGGARGGSHGGGGGARGGGRSGAGGASRSGMPGGGRGGGGMRGSSRSGISGGSRSGMPGGSRGGRSGIRGGRAPAGSPRTPGRSAPSDRFQRSRTRSGSGLHYRPHSGLHSYPNSGIRTYYRNSGSRYDHRSYGPSRYYGGYGHNHGHGSYSGFSFYFGLPFYWYYYPYPYGYYYGPYREYYYYYDSPRYYSYPPESNHVYTNESPGEVTEDTFADVRERMEKQRAADIPKVSERLAVISEVFRTGQYAQAMSLAETAVQDYPYHPVLEFAYSQTLFANGQYNKSADVLREALRKIDVTQGDVIFGLDLYPSREAFSDKVEMLRAASLAEPNDGDMQLLLGYQSAVIGRYDDAGYALTKAKADYVNKPAAAMLETMIAEKGTVPLK